MTRITVLLTLALAQTASTTPAPPTPREIAKNTYVLPGAVPPDRGPDGNTVIYLAPNGLIVVDTGRHPWHSDGILNFARDRKMPVTVIINTHWHLDHSSGNSRVKAAYPGAKMYTTTAVNRAIAPGGFLWRRYDATRAKPVDPNAPAVEQEETKLFLATMEKADLLRPDVPVERAAMLDLAGHKLSVQVAANAVTDADLWLYDESTRVAVLGDLVTFPAPFFETACPARWETALDEVWTTAFELAVPGHGAPMSREQFNTYRAAFKRFRACVATDGPAAACAAGWTKDIAPFLSSGADRRQSTEYASYYVGFLRKGGGASPECQLK